MRNHRLFGVVIAVLLGMSFVHQSPSSPHKDHQQIAGAHLGGSDVELASAALPVDGKTTPLALGEEQPIGLLRPAVAEHRLGDVDLASMPVPAGSPMESLADGDGLHVGLIRPAGTRYVQALIAWVEYQNAHPPPPPPPPAPVVKPVPVVQPAIVVVHHAVASTVVVAPATSAAGNDVWAELRKCESGGNYAENTGNGYYGAYQFAPGTWHGLGYPGLPSEASPAVQDQAARQLQARSGWGQWPECSRKLHLI
jgi:hypothetical protein